MEHLILNEINRLMPHGSITLDDVDSMRQIKKAEKAGGHDIFAIQYRDLTILVYITPQKKIDVKIVMW